MVSLEFTFYKFFIALFVYLGVERVAIPCPHDELIFERLRQESVFSNKILEFLRPVTKPHVANINWIKLMCFEGILTPRVTVAEVKGIQTEIINPLLHTKAKVDVSGRKVFSIG